MKTQITLTGEEVLKAIAQYLKQKAPGYKCLGVKFHADGWDHTFSATAEMEVIEEKSRETK